MTISSDRSKLIGLYNSPIGRKIITGITGLGLSLFVLIHMVGNLTLLASSKAYNQLAHFIDSLGILLYAIEFILLGFALFHIVVGISIRLNSLQARPVGYSQIKSAGDPSKQSLSSRSMAITGVVLLGFLALHLASFKFGTYYTTVIDGVEMRNLSRLVIEKFHHPVYAFGYTSVMVVLGVHLRHGIWSAWQSIGLLNSKISPLVYAIALVFAILIAIGFIILPLSIFFDLIS
ncbi:succinate dehydrogenase cytochrome b subunit [Waterburya agarophytonicola K14]|uniref:Succinate dehydrogenase cytochrome b subunit n=1 Tax=Waterburya agarophytonicola KI4 TaxID=2874699 RepID=A0A964BS62_9CYAN|nr:succinate dehydrogenase cytochrome b subunit [Waterburya agarophytonicola]MCC0178470.1 succinate dehydrogenase cytochrome b subunit [Waterburya agarophytonicola KI4]